ncbi:MAG: outer membrane protein assembly factor BamE [Bermanella sp.]
MQVYKLRVQQGNIVTPEMLEQLKPGMNKSQVAFVMGNPVLKDSFSTRQWDYLYRQERREDNIKKYHIRVHFDQGQKYSHYEGELPEQSDDKLTKKMKDKPMPKAAAKGTHDQQS